MGTRCTLQRTLWTSHSIVATLMRISIAFFLNPYLTYQEPSLLFTFTFTAWLGCKTNIANHSYCIIYNIFCYRTDVSKKRIVFWSLGYQEVGSIPSILNFIPLHSLFLSYNDQENVLKPWCANKNLTPVERKAQKKRELEGEAKYWNLELAKKWRK